MTASTTMSAATTTGNGTLIPPERLDGATRAGSATGPPPPARDGAGVTVLRGCMAAQMLHGRVDTVATAPPGSRGSPAL